MFTGLRIITGAAALIGMILLAVIWPLRIQAVKRKKGFKAENILRKHHIYIGILTIIFTVMHAFFSVPGSKADMMTGKLGFLALIITIIPFMFKKRLKSRWLIIHRYMTVITAIIILIHITGQAF